MEKKVVKITEENLNRIVAESVKKILKESVISSPISKWNYWCANFDDDFVEKVWADDPVMAKHLKGQFNEAYRIAGSYGAMTCFYLNLDGGNRRILENFVMNDYKG